MVIFITGGSKGLGKAMVERFALNNYTVIFTYNQSVADAELLTNRFSNVVAYKCDMRDIVNTKKIAEEILLKYKSIDVLINNAGYDNDATFMKMNEEIWTDVINVNLSSIFNFTQVFANSMIENGWGRIINLTSIAGFTGAFGKSNYSAAKAGVVGFTK